MIPVSDLMRRAVHASHNRYAQVDVYRNGQQVEQGIPVAAGSIVTDRNSGVRWTCNLTVALDWGQSLDIDVYSSRLKVWLGIDSHGIAERVQVGEYRVSDLDRNHKGQVNIVGESLEAYVIDARFLRPRTPAYGSSTIGAMRQLISEAAPGGSSVRVLATRDRGITKTKPWERDRDKALDSLGESINVEWYCAHDGVFEIIDAPDLNTGTPVYRIPIGADGVMMGEKITSGRDKVYNAVSVTGAAPEHDGPEVFGWAVDDDPNSPTYWHGPFGQVPRFYSSQYLTSNEMCAATARSRLGESKAANRKLSFSASPLPFLTAGDLVALQLADGSWENHILQRTKMDLDAGGNSGLDADTLATKVNLIDTEEPPG